MTAQEDRRAAGDHSCTLNRRRYVATALGVGTGVLAGCFADGDGVPPGETDGTNPGTGRATDTSDAATASESATWGSETGTDGGSTEIADDRNRPEGTDTSETDDGRSGDWIEVASLEELAAYAGENGNLVRMQPGVYELADYVSEADIEEMRADGDWEYLRFSGSDNAFDLTGVTIRVDTRIREALDPPVHTPEFLVTGERNTVEGLEVTNVGDGTSHGGNVLSVLGDRNTLRGVTLRVRGSWPYGYGDLLGKGANRVVGPPLHKHSGLRIAADHTRVVDTSVIMRSFGHAFYMQGGATDTYFENCYAEGEMRTTDEMLAETSGPAHENDFEMVWTNREGENEIMPGYMKSLAEDGFRTYDGSDVTCVDCTVKNMRSGWELGRNSHLESCRSIENERGMWVGADSVIEDCRGDATYGYALWVHGSDCTVDFELMPAVSDRIVHATAILRGSGHDVTITPHDGAERSESTPIKFGFDRPQAGENMAPITPGTITASTLTNRTRMPVEISDGGSDCLVRSKGPVEDRGEGNTVRDI